MTPKALLDKPTLSEGVVRFWIAYSTLNNSRTYHMAGSNPIQISEVKAYFDLIGESDADYRETALRHIKRLDNMFVDDEVQKSKSKTKGK